MPLKLIMTWDIAPNREQEYFEFVIREFIPGIQQLGLDLSEAWATVYGGQPQIQVGALIPDRQTARMIMNSEDWKALNGRLHDYVINYRLKLIPARGGFQM